MKHNYPDTTEEFLQLIEDSLEQAKQAYNELQEERKERVRLEKIASEVKTSNEKIIKDLVDLLIDEDYIDHREKNAFIADLKEEPERVSRIMVRLVENSAPISSSGEGRGIPKQASERDDQYPESDLWTKVITEGA